MTDLEKKLQKCLHNADEALTIPPECYSNEKIYEIEKKAFFYNQWIPLGHVNHLKNSGDFFTKEVANVPIIVIRDKKNNLRIFSNVCRHRGARLLSGSGNVKGIICPFHSWAYNLNGDLSGAPEMKDAKNFHKNDYGLREFNSRIINGFGFVEMNDNSSLEDQLNNFQKIHSQWPINNLVCTRRRSFQVACNWKLFLEVFNEYYHLPFVHPETIGSVYQKPLAPENTNGSFTSQLGKTSGTGALLEKDQHYALPKMDGIHKEVVDSVRYTWIFPNLTFAISDDALWIYEADPIDAKNSLITQSVCFPNKTINDNNFQKLSLQYYHRMDAAIQEDIVALENQQEGLNSFFALQGRFSPLLEANVAAFAKWYAKKLIDTDLNSTNSNF
tara:strand:- start:2885 stop:4042 length:1158 start_codon:yes stop_codon:yes gene_type:complete